MKFEEQPTQAETPGVIKDPVLELAVRRTQGAEDKVKLTRSMSQVSAISHVILMHTPDTETALVLAQLEYRMRRFSGVPAEDIAAEDNAIEASGKEVGDSGNAYEKGWFPYRMKYLEDHVFPHMSTRSIRRRVGKLKDSGWIWVKGTCPQRMMIRVNIRRLIELNSVYNTTLKFWEDAGLKASGITPETSREETPEADKPGTESDSVATIYHEKEQVSTTDNDKEIVKGHLEDAFYDLGMRPSPGFWESQLVTDLTKLADIEEKAAAKSGAAISYEKSCGQKWRQLYSKAAAKSGAPYRRRRNILRRMLETEEKKNPYIPFAEGDFFLLSVKNKQNDWEALSRKFPKMDPEEFINKLPGKEYLRVIHPDFGNEDFFCPEFYRAMARQIRKGGITLPLLIQVARLGVDGREKFFQKTTWQDTWKHVKTGSAQEKLNTASTRLSRKIWGLQERAGAIRESELEESEIEALGLEAACSLARIRRPGHKTIEKRLLESKHILSNCEDPHDYEKVLSLARYASNGSIIKSALLGEVYDVDPELAARRSGEFETSMQGEILADYDLAQHVLEWSDEKLNALFGLSSEELREHWVHYRNRLTLAQALFGDVEKNLDEDPMGHE